MTEAATHKLTDAQWARTARTHVDDPTPVRETTTTTGTGPLTLGGAVGVYQAASAVYAVDDVFQGAITDGQDWEYGYYTRKSGGTIARSLILGSTNDGAAVNWPAGTKLFVANVPDAREALQFLIFEYSAPAAGLMPADIGVTVQGYDADLAAIAGVSSNGLLARTGAGTAAARALIGTANQVTVSNGDGVSGNPTLSLPQSIDAGATVTFGSLALGTPLSAANGGTGLSSLGTGVATALGSNVTGSGGIVLAGSPTLTGTARASGLVFGSGAAGTTVFNTADETTNVEKVVGTWASNVYTLGTATVGSGSGRSFRIYQQLSNAAASFNALTLANTAPFIRAGRYISATSVTILSNTATGTFFQIDGMGSNTATSGTIVAMGITPTYNQPSGTAANTDLLINRTPTAIGSGTQRLIDAKVGGNTLFSVGDTGNVGAGMSAVAAAKVHIGAGTTAASTAPLKLTSGTSMTSEEAGAVEFTTDDLFFTITTGPARKRVMMADPVGGLTSGRVPFGTTNGRQTDAAGFEFDGTYLKAPELQFGAHSGIGIETLTGFIPVKDTLGNTRKLAVIS